MGGLKLCAGARAWEKWILHTEIVKLMHAWRKNRARHRNLPKNPAQKIVLRGVAVLRTRPAREAPARTSPRTGGLCAVPGMLQTCGKLCCDGDALHQKCGTRCCNAGGAPKNRVGVLCGGCTKLLHATFPPAPPRARKGLHAVPNILHVLLVAWHSIFANAGKVVLQ